MVVNLAKISEIISVCKHSFPLINVEIPGDSDPWGQADKTVQRTTCCQGDGSVHLLDANPYHHYRRHQTDNMFLFFSDCAISLSSWFKWKLINVNMFSFSSKSTWLSQTRLGTSAPELLHFPNLTQWLKVMKMTKTPSIMKRPKICWWQQCQCHNDKDNTYDYNGDACTSVSLNMHYGPGGRGLSRNWGSD